MKDIPSYLFWNVVRTNPILDKGWMWAKRNTPLSTLINKLAPYPTGIEVEVTTKCGLRCIMCEHTYWDEPTGDMTFEQFTSIIDQFPNLRWVGLTGIGEGSLHKDWNRMLRYLKGRGVQMEFFDTLNFVNEEDLKVWVDLGIYLLWISLDAATKGTYEKIRVRGDFDKVVQNVRRLFRLKDARSRVWFHYIVNRYNIDEMLQFIDLVDELRQEWDTTIQFTRILQGFREIKDILVEIPKDLRRRVDEKGKAKRIGIVWNADVPERKPQMKRCLEFFEPFIFVTGDVIPCCATNETNRRDYQRSTALGNALEEPFKEIWNGKRYIQLRRMLREGKVPPPCDKCPIYRR